MGPTVGAQKAFGGVKCSRTNTKTSGSFHRTQRGHARSLKKALRLLQSVPKPGWGGGGLPGTDDCGVYGT